MSQMANKDVNAGYWFCHTHSQLPPSDIKAELFTHLFCGYAGINPSSPYNVTIDPAEEAQILEFSSTVKIRNKNVTTILSIGGNNAKQDRFAAMARKRETRNNFIRSAIDIARKFHFDGLDLQWLYPSSGSDMVNLEALLHEWQKETDMFLIATVFYAPFYNYNRYPVEAFRKTLKWVNVITYDFYTPFSSYSKTGPSSIFRNPEQRHDLLCAYSGINAWVLEGLPHDMIVFGIPFHGWAWELVNPEDHYLFSRADGAAGGGRDITSAGLIEYLNIEKFRKANNAPLKVLKDYEIVYTYCGKIWIAYDDKHTIEIKIPQVKDLGLRGYFAWNIAGDDEDNTLANTAFNKWKEIKE